MKTEREAAAGQCHDPVNHPSHYTSGAVECIDAIEAALGPVGLIAFLRGQVIRYNWRMGLKDAPVQEAGKAKWYMDLLAKRLGAGQANWPQPPTRQQQHPIQSEALTDKKETTNGTNEPNTRRIYGTLEELRKRFGAGSIHQDPYPGGTGYLYYVIPASST